MEVVKIQMRLQDWMEAFVKWVLLIRILGVRFVLLAKFGSLMGVLIVK